MSGPFFLVLANLEKGTDRIAFSRKLCKLAAENDIGLIVGKFLVGHVLEEDDRFFKNILARVSQPFVFLVTSYAGENDVRDLFEEQLNPSRGADPSKSNLLAFLKAAWSLRQIEIITAVLWDSAVPVLEGTPWLTITFDEFIEKLVHYYDRTSPQIEILTVPRRTFSQLRA